MPAAIPSEAKSPEPKSKPEKKEETIPAQSADVELIMDLAVTSLIDGKPLSMEQKGDVVEQLHTTEGREVLAYRLSDITQPTLVAPMEAFKCFSEVVGYLLTMYVMERTLNNEVTIIVLTLSRNIYTIVLLAG